MSSIDKASQPDPENPEWTDEMASGALRMADLPASLQAKLRGRPRAAVVKERTTIRLSADVLAHFRATGSGWQTRIDAALKEWLAQHPQG
jgi:uncharacterized protein (DUF4415 family)